MNQTFYKMEITARTSGSVKGVVRWPNGTLQSGVTEGATLDGPVYSRKYVPVIGGGGAMRK